MEDSGGVLLPALEGRSLEQNRNRVGLSIKLLEQSLTRTIKRVEQALMKLEESLVDDIRMLRRTKKRLLLDDVYTNHTFTLNTALRGEVGGGGGGGR